MTKFGALIGVETPILINFYKAKKSIEVLKTLKEVSVMLGERAKIVKIDMAKNELLADALKIKGNNTYVIYKEGEMKWRQTGEITSEVLAQTLQQFM